MKDVIYVNDDAAPGDIALRQTVILAGASGFLGQHLRRRFQAQGWNVRTIGRGSSSREASWTEPSELTRTLNGARLLINLAGRSVSCRYNAKNRQEILDSRVRTTRILGQAMAECASPPRDWFNASTATIYRHAEDHSQSEHGGETGSDFSVSVAQAWEEALAEVELPGVRRIPLRLSIVLGPLCGAANFGVIGPLQNLARLGLAGPMGPGSQKFSWVHIDDVYRAVGFLLEHPEISGPVNIAAPGVVDNRELMRNLRQEFGLPFGLPASKWMLEIGARLIRTETELVLKSRWIESAKLNSAGFKWRFPELAPALGDIHQQQRARKILQGLKSASAS